MMEVPVPKKEEKKVEEEEEIIKKEERKEMKKESLTTRILKIFFGWPPYDPDTYDISLGYKLSYLF
jgi:hypothetical protein